MYFDKNQNQRGDISTKTAGSTKILDKFTDLENNESSTESDINTRLAKAWWAIDRLSYLPTPPLEQGMTQCQFLSGV